MTSCKQVGCLTLVSTPIGHLKDLTFRALEVLQKADIVVCEDTRVTRKLLDAYQISPPALWTYHEHNAPAQRPKILEALLSGRQVALVSDAGTPLISDPGYRLVREAQDKKIPVTAAPGVSAAVTALSLSGLPPHGFYFGGFLPRKTGERQRLFKGLAPLEATLIFYESARRVLPSLEDMVPFFSGREAALARELTKRFEEITREPLDNLLQTLQARPPLKGEVVLLIGPPTEQETREADLDEALHKALATMSLKDAVTAVSQALDLSRKRVYERALVLKPSAPSPPGVTGE